MTYTEKLQAIKTALSSSASSTCHHAAFSQCKSALDVKILYIPVHTTRFKSIPRGLAEKVHNPLDIINYFQRYWK